MRVVATQPHAGCKTAAAVMALAVAVAACGTGSPSPSTVPAGAAPAAFVEPPPRADKAFWGDCQALVPYEAYAADILQVDSRRPERLLLAHTTRGLHASDDAGESWYQLTPRGACHQPLDSFAVASSLPETLCLQAHSESSPFYLEIFCSDDVGKTFRPLRVPSGYEDFAVAPQCDPQQPRRLVATLWSFGCPPTSVRDLSQPPCETLAWSADAGRSWEIIGSQRASHLQVALGRGDPPILYVVHGTHGPRFAALHRCSMDMRCSPVLRSGEPCTFTNLVDLQVNPGNPEQLLFDWGADGLWISADAGATCQPLTETGEYMEPPRFIAGTPPWGVMARLGWDIDGRILFLSRDGGQSWGRAAQPLPSEAGDLVANFAGKLFYGGFGAFYRSDDLGNSWVALPFPGQLGSRMQKLRP